MKRLFIVASLAIMAVACQKTEVKNLVTNEIGFSAEIGKMTRAIVQNDEDNPRANVTYPQSQPFGVYSYATQGGAPLGRVMENVEISYEGGSWKNAETPYYWPNESNTLLSFYAYSPYTDDMNHTTEGGFAFEYTHDPTCDFMVAEKVGVSYGNTENGVVAIEFSHEMTQVQFVVKQSTQSGVSYTVQSITLNNVAKVADYVQNPTSGDQWTPTDYYGEYDPETNEGYSLTVVNANGKPQTTTPVTMIPQGLDNASFTVVYTIGGDVAANETVTRELPLTAATVAKWEANKKITYNLTMTLKEISFAPVVAPWEEVTTNDIDIKPEEEEQEEE